MTDFPFFRFCFFLNKGVTAYMAEHCCCRNYFPALGTGFSQRLFSICFGFDLY